jgi:hypothetical protein
MMSPSGKVIPAQAHGIKVISMGMLTDDDKPAILRGPMVSKYLRMFILGADWGKLDYLILDLPPGTGDTQLTLAQLSADWGSRGQHATGRQPENCPTRHSHVAAGQGANPWYRRKHERVYLPILSRGNAHFPSRRGREDCGQPWRTVSGCHTA